MFDSIIKRFSRKKDTNVIAKQRLKFALLYDKLEISEDTLKNLHKDMVDVISKYFEIDQTAFKLDIRRSDDLSSLVVNTPIISAKRNSQLSS